MGKNDHFIVFAKSLFPLTNPPAIRTVSIVKYMLRQGWQVHLFVWKSDPIDYDGHPYLRNARLHLMGIESSRNYFYYFVNIFRTLRFMLRVLRKLEGKICFFASVPQMQGLLLGALIKKRFPITLVEELRDVYSMNLTKKRGILYQTVLRKIEATAMKEVDRFIFVTPIIKDEYARHFSTSIPRIEQGAVIYNSVDEDELRDLFRDVDDLGAHNGIFFTYIGNLYGSRNLDAFLNALGTLKRDMDVSPVHVRIIGRVSLGNRAVLNAIILQHGLESQVEWLEPLPHKNAMREIARSDFNILVTHRQGSEYAIPSKLFEYMFVRKPIFAITQDPLVIDLMEQYKLGACSDFSEEKIARTLQYAIKECEFLQNRIGPFPKEFTRAYTTKQISDFIRQ